MKAKSLDHFVLAVNQLESAAEAYGRLGFHVRPIAHHIDVGSRNCVIHLPNTYLELADLNGALDWVAAPYRDRLAFGEGLAHVCLTSDDLEEEQKRVRELGLEPLPIVSARREILLPNGEKDETASDFFYMWRKSPRYLSLFFTEHKKPETIFIPEYEKHPNSVIDVNRLVYMSLDPSADIDYFSRAFGSAADSSKTDGFTMRGVRGDVTEVLTPEAAVARYGQHLAVQSPEPLTGIGVAMHFSIADLEQCREALDQGAVSFSEFENGVIVAAADACGCALVFERESDG